MRQVLPDGTVYSLEKLDENGHPVYYATDFNTRAAATTRTDQLWEGGSLRLNLSGNSAAVAGKMALWDGGPVKGTHRELTGRVVQRDAGAIVDAGTGTAHATHVAGTMTGRGVQPQARGMANGFARLQAYDFSSDIAEMAAAAADLLVSNHSYGTTAGWRLNPNRAGTAADPQWEWLGDVNISTTEDLRFGYYNSDTHRWDEITFNAPYYLPVKSAGNFRSQNGPAVGQPFWRRNASGTFELIASRPEGISSNNGYDNVTTYGTAKNILTIGAVEPIPRGYNQPADVRMASFSSWGPTDDGRIKPDLVANGVAVFSASSNSDSAYATFNGTSMATPNVSGTLMLLQEYHASLNNGAFMRAATLKGLVIHTADEAGTAPGPDYAHGWGLLNAQRAAQVTANENNDHLISERELAHNGNYTLTAVASGRGPLTVTLSWTDPPGAAAPAAAASLNSRTPRLVNDLDVRISDDTGTWLPWTLNPEAPAGPAAAGDNIRDNVEQIRIENAVPGRMYTIRISHKGSLQNGSQTYSLIASGIGGKTFCASAAASEQGLLIGSVTAGTLSSNSAAGCATYTDFTQRNASVAPGQRLPLTVGTGSCRDPATGIVKVFVDWNGDSDFTGPGETAAVSGVLAGTASFTAGINVPGSVLPGSAVRMRIVLAAAADPDEVVSCGSYPSGETEDYTLRVIRPENDVAAAALLFPEGEICAGTTGPVTVAVRNMGTGTISGIPAEAVIREGNSERTLTGTFAGRLAPFEEGRITLNGNFTPEAGKVSTFFVRTNWTPDQNRANDTLSFRRTAALPPPAPAAKVTICASDTVQLEASGSGTVYWYDAPAGGNLLAAGNRTFTTVKTSGLTYYAAVNDFAGKTGPADKNFAAGGGYNQFTPAILITAQVPLVIESARLYVGNPGRVTFTVETPSGIPVLSRTLDVEATRNPPAAGAVPDVPSDTGRVYLLNLTVPQRGNYRISVAYENGATLYRNNAGVAGYPFRIPGVFSVTGNTATGNPETFYYYLYDIKVRAAGCAGPRAAAAATLIPDPAPTARLAGGGTICAGDTAEVAVHLTGTPPWNLTYSDGITSRQATRITQTPYLLRTVRVGTFSVTALTDAKSCPVFRVEGSAVVTVRSRPPATIGVSGPALTASEGFSYRWFRNDSLLTEVTTRGITIERAGVYQVEVTYENGCRALSEKVTVRGAGQAAVTLSEIRLFPNPTTGRIVLRAGQRRPAVKHIRLMSIAGQTLRTWQPVRTTGWKEIELDLAGLKAGIYLLSVEEENQVQVFRVYKR